MNKIQEAEIKINGNAEEREDGSLTRLGLLVTLEGEEIWSRHYETLVCVSNGQILGLGGKVINGNPAESALRRLFIELCENEGLM